MSQGGPYCALVILTAGRSSRMGEPKALLRFGHHTALEIAIHNAVKAGVSRVVAVVGHRAEEIRAAHSFKGMGMSFDWAINLEPESPMIASLQTGLQALEDLPLDGFFFQPVDYPLVLPQDYKLLMDALETRNENSRVIQPTCKGDHGHPVLCDISLKQEFLDLEPDETARTVISRETITYVETANPGVLLDMDSPDEYRQLKTIYSSRNERAH